MTAQVKKPARKSKTPAILALATKTNLTAPEIAESLNISNQAVHDTLQRYGIDYEYTQKYKDNRSDILAGLQSKILRQLDDDKIKSMCARDMVMSYGILYDKERLERGGSTEAKPLIIVNRINISNSMPIQGIEQNTQVIDITHDKDIDK